MASTKAANDESIKERNRRQEENIAAQRAAAEAISISRATLETTLSQGEQLQHCDNLRERHQYVVDRSARVVRGMTWSGWMMNVVSKDIEPPSVGATSAGLTNSVEERRSQDAVSRALGDSDVFDVPEQLQDQSCILQNYECNVLLLEQCQSRDEFNMCLDVCKKLNTSARKSLDDTARNGNGNGTGRLNGRVLQLFRKLERKFEQVEGVQFHTVQRLANRFAGEKQGKASEPDDSSSSSSKLPPMSKTPPNRLWATTNDTKMQSRIKEQDGHLDALAVSIQELLHTGTSIGVSLEQQNQLLETLGADTEDLIEQTKMVTRRADRLSHRSVSPTSFEIPRVQSVAYNDERRSHGSFTCIHPLPHSYGVHQNQTSSAALRLNMSPQKGF